MLQKKLPHPLPKTSQHRFVLQNHSAYSETPKHSEIFGIVLMLGRANLSSVRLVLMLGARVFKEGWALTPLAVYQCINLGTTNREVN